MLEQEFASDGSLRVKALRESLQTAVREQQIAARDAWLERYESVLNARSATRCSASSACRPPAPPAGAPLTSRAGRRRGAPTRRCAHRATLAERAERRRCARRATPGAPGRRSAGAIEGSQAAELVEFHERVNFVAPLRGRDEARAKERERTIRFSFEQQDMLLAVRRAHAHANDLRPVAPPAPDRHARLGAVARLLASEIAAVEAHFNALVEARELARHGAHREALERSRAPVTTRRAPAAVSDRLLPQARACAQDESSTRTTPVVLDVAPGESWRSSLTGRLESERIVIDDPADQRAVSRKPEVGTTSASVEALPVSVDHGHVVCDRAGRIARLAHDTELAGRRSSTAGGIARTPCSCVRARRVAPGVDRGRRGLVGRGRERSHRGPVERGLSAGGGPLPAEGGVSATLSDGTRAVWQAR